SLPNRSRDIGRRATLRSLTVNSRRRTLSPTGIDLATAKGSHDRGADPPSSDTYAHQAGRFHHRGCTLDRSFNLGSYGPIHRTGKGGAGVLSGHFQPRFYPAVA